MTVGHKASGRRRGRSHGTDSSHAAGVGVGVVAQWAVGVDVDAVAGAELRDATNRPSSDSDSGAVGKPDEGRWRWAQRRHFGTAAETVAAA
jgi:hypothetical protein